MSSIINFCSAQNILDDMELHLFKEIFNPANKISELIELNEFKDTTRYWKFNENFQLIKEVDDRPSIWPYTVGWYSSARPSKKIYEYKYHSNGKLDTIDESHTSEGETMNTIHLFTYPDRNTITEFYQIDLNEHIKFDYEFTRILSESNIIESRQITKNYIGDGYVQTNQILKYEYDEILKEINHYFKVISYPLNSEEKPMQEILGAKTTYHYDNFGRLHNIHNVEYTEEGIQKLNRDICFMYRGQSNKIEKIKLEYGESYTPREFEYSVEYEKNGDLKTINANGKIYSYIFKR